MNKLNECLSSIQVKFKTKKTRYNSFGKYYFRSAEDILEAIKPFLEEYSVTVRIDEEVIAADPMPMLRSVASISDGTNSIQASAIVGVDLNQKGMQVPQQFGSASSYGKKYALGNLFLIDDTQDADATNDHGKSSSVVDKPVLTGKDLEKAKDYLKNGGKIDVIKMKYTLSKDIENQLMKEQL